MRSGLIHSAEQTPAGRSAGRWRAPTPRCVAERGDEHADFLAPRPTTPAADGAAGTDRGERGAAVERAERNSPLPAHRDVGRRGTALRRRRRARPVVRAARLQQRELPPKTPRRVGGLDERAARVAPPLCDAQQPLPRAVRRACPSLASRLVKRSACARTFPARMVTRSCRRNLGRPNAVLRPLIPSGRTGKHSEAPPTTGAPAGTTTKNTTARKSSGGTAHPGTPAARTERRGRDARGDRGGLERTRPRATASQWPRRRAGSNSSRSCPICAPRPAAVQRVLRAQPERHRARSDPR